VGLLVLQPGLCSTVQDGGRPGYREWGVSAAGAFDLGSHNLANALLGNSVHAATLELTLLGGSFRAEAELGVAMAGAPMEARVCPALGAARRLETGQTTTLDPGDELILRGTPRGARTYLAVLGGWQTPALLGSRSSEARLRAGDQLPADSGKSLVRRLSDASWPDPTAAPLRFVAGPDSPLGLGQDWDRGSFQVDTHCDRMGLRLNGPELPRGTDPERLSTPVVPGTIQLAGGRLIVLGIACGTMGGYPVVGHVISADLDRLGQARPGDWLQFQRVEVPEARRLDREHRRAQAERWSAIASVTASAARKK
jgi:biotin-dependent carboxylase-like uncharacterized protein